MKRIIYFLFIGTLFSSCNTDNSTHETQTLEESYQNDVTKYTDELTIWTEKVGLDELMSKYDQDDKDAADRKIVEEIAKSEILYRRKLTHTERENIELKHYTPEMFKTMELIRETRAVWKEKMKKIIEPHKKYQALKLDNQAN